MSAVPDRDRDQLSSEALARRLAAVADAKQAEDVVALDMRSLVSYTDFLVICTARNERLAKAIHEEVHQRLKQEYGVVPATVDGGPAGWQPTPPLATLELELVSRKALLPNA